MRLEYSENDCIKSRRTSARCRRTKFSRIWRVSSANCEGETEGDAHFWKRAAEDSGSAAISELLEPVERGRRGVIERIDR